jgi:hypothetical protein
MSNIAAMNRFRIDPSMESAQGLPFEEVISVPATAKSNLPQA